MPPIPLQVIDFLVRLAIVWEIPLRALVILVIVLVLTPGVRRRGVVRYRWVRRRWHRLTPGRREAGKRWGLGVGLAVVTLWQPWVGLFAVSVVLLARWRWLWRQWLVWDLDQWLFTWRLWPLIGLFVVGGTWLIWQQPELAAKGIAENAAKPRWEVVNEIRRTWMQLVAGIGGLIALLLSWLRSWLNARDVAVKEREIKVTESADLTDRYTKAVEMLGAMKGDQPNLEVRLGAIYALEAIAKDSEQFYPMVLEVLSAYVRENTRQVEVPGGMPEPGAPREEYERWVETIPKPRLDVQAAVTVFGRTVEKDRTEAGAQMDLQGAVLPRVDGLGLDLRFANLREVQMQGANLFRAQLESAYLSGARLQGAYLTEAQLPCADLVEAHMAGTVLVEAQLQDAKLIGAQLQSATLVRAQLQGAYFGRAKLQGANLREAQLQGANLHEAQLQCAILTKAQFQGKQSHILPLPPIARRDDRLGRVIHYGSPSLTPKQVLEAKDWESASFEPSFRAELEAEVARRASGGGDPTG